jgi:diguanylate cyclase (GGDEF)-like protein/PAS domain S-box-containing protein
MFLIDNLLSRSHTQTSGELNAKQSDGGVFPASYTAATLSYQNEITGAVITIRDITERRKEEEKLRLAANIIENSHEGIMVLNMDGLIQDVNPGFSYITGYGRDEVVLKNPRVLKSGRHDVAFYKQMWSSLAITGRWQGEVWNRRKSGEVYPEWLSISVLKDNNGKITHYVGLFSDITSRKLAEQKLDHLAHHDMLTGLPNRMLVKDRLHQAIMSAQRKCGSVGVLYLDLDLFKPINDTYGHEAGDHVLRTVANRLRTVIRRSDTAARIGGDEFLIVLHDVREFDDVIRVTEKIIESISEPISVNHHVCQIGVSVGVAVFPKDGGDVEALINNSDCAMYQAKKQGKNQYALFCPSLCKP